MNNARYFTFRWGFSKDKLHTRVLLFRENPEMITKFDTTLEDAITKGSKIKWGDAEVTSCQEGLSKIISNKYYESGSLTEHTEKEFKNILIKWKLKR